MNNLRELSDDRLLEELGRLVGSRHRLTARMLTYLIEIEDRQLHLRRAFSSMWNFCIEQLGMAEGETQRHLVAARMAREFPIVIELVRTGKVHLSGLALLHPHLTEENHLELLGEAAGKTMRQIEALLAARFPKPDVPDTITKASSASGRAVPLSADHYKIQFTASQQLVDKIEHARNLLSHANPGRELSVVVERAIDLLIAELERTKLGKTDRPRRGQPAKRGTVTRATRRQVVGRDGLRCAWVDHRTGRRCAARAFLEFDHVTPRACGGSGEPDQVRVLCRGHNRFYAEQVYGRELIEHKMDSRYRKRVAARHSGNEAPPEASANDTELASMYTKIERVLTQQGYRARQAAWAIVRLRERHAADLSRPTLVELLREAFLLLAPECSAPR